MRPSGSCYALNGLIHFMSRGRSYWDPLLSEVDLSCIALKLGIVGLVAFWTQPYWFLSSRGSSFAFAKGN